MAKIKTGRIRGAAIKVPSGKGGTSLAGERTRTLSKAHNPRGHTPLARPAARTAPVRGRDSGGKGQG